MTEPQRHISFNVQGVKVTFPFEPYSIQRDYIESVITAANNRQNALLESPTGTGKTLSLLCSTLAWQQNSKTPGKMIYYTSRTHIQLSQAAKEMKKTAYARVPAVVLASRTHMCLNDEVKNQASGQDRSINRACHNATAKNACSYYTNYEQKLEANLDINKVHDIEDLFKFGKASQCCPYYASRKIAESKASIVFMPYNYLLDLSIQKTVKLKVNDSIVIFDEGHNIESALKESASAQFTEYCLTVLQESCEKLPSKLSEALNSELHGITRYGFDPEKKRKQIVDEFSTKNTSKKKDSDKEPKVNPIEELAEKLTNDKLQQVRKCAMSLMSCKDMMKSHQGQYTDTKCSVDSVYFQLDKAGVDFRTSDQIITTLDAMSTFWSIAGVMSPSLIARYLGAIGNLSHFISIMFPPGFLTKPEFDKHVASLREFHSAYLTPEFEKQSVLVRSNTLVNWTLHIWCLHPAIGLKRVLDATCVDRPRSLIITSGTLAPMEPMEKELEIKFPIIKEFDHLISEDQFKILILGESPKQYSLVSTHKGVNELRYPLEIGESLLSLFKVLPFGTLVFFPSYPLLERIYKFWKNSRALWDQMSKATTIFKESSHQPTFSDDMINFKKKVDSNNKAVFLGVFRGKLSEGTNLQANHCRSVIIIGLPFPSLKDPRIIETREFHSKKGDTHGQIWYTQQMRRALGQAIGRVIRSRNDFGMLFLCDPRFAHYKFALSKWITKFYPSYSETDYEEIVGKIRDFFGGHNVDIASMCNNDLSNTLQNAFEFETISKKRTSNFGTNLAKTPCSNSNGHLRVTNNNGFNTATSLNCIQIEKDKFLSQYRVDKETYQKAQERKRAATIERNERGETKKCKTIITSDKQNEIWDMSGRELGDPIAQIDNNGSGTSIIENQNVNEQTSMQKQPLKPPTKTKKASKNMFATRKQTNNAPVTGDLCYVCFKPSDLYLTNCKCARKGHKKCLLPLNNTDCASCGEKLKLRNFKQILFNL